MFSSRLRDFGSFVFYCPDGFDGICWCGHVSHVPPPSHFVNELCLTWVGRCLYAGSARMEGGGVRGGERQQGQLHHGLQHGGMMGCRISDIV